MLLVMSWSVVKNGDSEKMVWNGTCGIDAPALEVLCLHHNSSIIADYTGVQHRSATLSKTHLSWDAPSCSPLHEA